MKQLLPFLLFLFSISRVFGNDTLWKYTPPIHDLSIRMPGTIHEADTGMIRTVSAMENGYIFQVKYFKPAFVVHNRTELEQSYKGCLDGWLGSKNVRLYTHTITDTSLAGTSGKWIHSVYAKDSYYMEFLTYLVFANGHFYMISVSNNKPFGKDMLQPISSYFQSIKFPALALKEYTGHFPPQVKNNHTHQQSGVYLRIFFIAALSGLLIYLVYGAATRNKKKKQSP